MKDWAYKINRLGVITKYKSYERVVVVPAAEIEIDGRIYRASAISHDVKIDVVEKEIYRFSHYDEENDNVAVFEIYRGCGESDYYYLYEEDLEHLKDTNTLMFPIYTDSDYEEYLIAYEAIEAELEEKNKQAIKIATEKFIAEWKN